MKLGFSSTENWWWRTRQETPNTIFEITTEPLAVAPAEIAEVFSNLIKIDWFHSLPFQRFQALLTLFSKFFSSFPHGTCILSVSNLYLASDETYHQLCAPIPRNVTLRKRTVHRGLQMTNGALTLFSAPCPRVLHLRPCWLHFYRLQFKAETARISKLSCSLFIRHY